MIKCNDCGNESKFIETMPLNCGECKGRNFSEIKCATNKGEWGESCGECGEFWGRMNTGKRKAKVHTYKQDGKTMIECSRLFSMQQEVFDEEYVEAAQKHMAQYIDTHFDFILLLTKDWYRAKEMLSRIQEELEKEEMEKENA